MIAPRGPIAQQTHTDTHRHTHDTHDTHRERWEREQKKSVPSVSHHSSTSVGQKNSNY